MMTSVSFIKDFYVFLYMRMPQMPLKGLLGGQSMLGILNGPT